MGGAALRLFALVITVFAGLPAKAAEITCAQAVVPDEYAVQTFKAKGRAIPTGLCVAISIQGPIVEGDYERFRSVLRNGHPFIRTVYISSPGGNVFEAVRIGRLTRHALLETWAPLRGIQGAYLLTPDPILCEGPDCVSASACFLVWAAGIRQIGDVIGVHRPRTSDSHYGKLSANEATALHATIMREIAAYFDALSVPPRYFQLMERTHSADMHWLTEDERAADFQGFIPGIAEWLRGNCGSLSRTDRERLNYLTTRVMNRQATTPERATYAQLRHQDTAIASCEGRKLFESRHAIAID
jgi:hypothetical protein